jgi:hypothetical protein
MNTLVTSTSSSWREPAAHGLPYRIAEAQCEEGTPMQTMVLDERLDRRTRADRQPHNTADHTAASAETPELVARASTGDQVAWDQLVERYGGMVWAVARAQGLGPHDAGDVSQVTWLLLTQHLGSLQRPDPRSAANRGSGPRLGLKPQVGGLRPGKNLGSA